VAVVAAVSAVASAFPVVVLAEEEEVAGSLLQRYFIKIKEQELLLFVSLPRNNLFYKTQNTTVILFEN